MQNPSNLCPQCQSPIPADAPGGLCPACVLLGVAGPTNPSQVAAANTPTIEEVAAAFPELEVLEFIGQGGMGVVFKARQPRLDRMVALKILPPALAAQPGFAERFTREARVLARLAHPHIVALYDFGESAGFFYLTMEFVNGVNLRAAMRAGVKPEQALLLVPHICEALQFAHDHGVLHRDIKPENILLDTAGTPKLADFGIAKLAGEESGKTGLTATGAALGTAAYMAPEQVEKPATVDHRADIYSLGVVLYEMLTGELPLGRFAAPSEKSTVHRGVDDVVMRALEKERERRQQSATEMKAEVEHASVAENQPPALPARSRELPWSRAAAWGAGLVAASVPLGLLLFLIAWLVVSSEHDVQGQLAGPVAGNIIIFGFLPALIGTLLGWKAISDLRYHRGHLRGGGTAVTAALAVPVLTLIVTLLVYFPVIKAEISPSKMDPWGAIIATLTVIAGIAASVWAVRALWRFVHDGPPGVPRLPQSPRATPGNAANPWPHRLFWLAGGRLGLPVVLVVVALIVPMLSRTGAVHHGIGTVEVLFVVVLLPVVVVLALIFGYLRTRPTASRATPPADGNPWPKRVFLLIVVLLVLPISLVALRLLVAFGAWVPREQAVATLAVESQAHMAEKQIAAQRDVIAIQDEAIRIARERLSDTKKRVEIGVATPLDLGVAERDLAVVEARGHRVKIAEAGVAFAQVRIGVVKAQVQTGAASTAEMLDAEEALNNARLKLEEARRISGMAREYQLEPAAVEKPAQP